MRFVGEVAEEAGQREAGAVDGGLADAPLKADVAPEQLICSASEWRV